MYSVFILLEHLLCNKFGIPKQTSRRGSPIHDFGIILCTSTQPGTVGRVAQKTNISQ